jgi:hypothetical protein
MEDKMKRNRLITFALFAVAFTLVPLAAHAKTSIFSAHLSGAQMNPARLTNAVGEAKFNVNPDGSQLGFRVNVSNIENVVATEIRLGPAGSDGEVVATIYGPVAPGGGKKSGTLAQGTITASSLSGSLAGQPLSALINAMQSGDAFVLIRTDSGTNPLDVKPGNFPNGEIRGQIK